MLKHLSTTLFLAMTLNTPAIAADISPPGDQVAASCAVAGINAKAEIAGGKIDSDQLDGGRKHVAGSVTIPIGCGLGLQIDGSYGRLDNVDSSAIAGHFFTRDPDKYLIGIYGSYNSINNSDFYRFGLEGDLYFDQFTLSGIVGKENSDLDSNGFFGAGRLSFYPTENFQINAGFARFLDNNAFITGVEWQLEDTNISLFADAAFGEDNHRTVFAGIRFYFGDQKSLIRRHREDDPINWTAMFNKIARNNPGLSFDELCARAGGVVIPDPLNQGDLICQPLTL